MVGSPLGFFAGDANTLLLQTSSVILILLNKAFQSFLQPVWGCWVREEKRETHLFTVSLNCLGGLQIWKLKPDSLGKLEYHSACAHTCTQTHTHTGVLLSCTVFLFLHLWIPSLLCKFLLALQQQTQKWWARKLCQPCMHVCLLACCVFCLECSFLKYPDEAGRGDSSVIPTTQKV
jgi:hypothetical protein